MKKYLLPAAIFIAVFCISETATAQCPPPPQTLTIQNPSFEGSTLACCVTPAPWTECGLIPNNVSVQLVGTPTVETPDTQPGWWTVSMPPTNGTTYLGLVWDSLDYTALVGVAPPFVWQEGASQMLSAPMVAGVPYTFTLDLANSTQAGGGGCAELQIWGGFGPCDVNTLLWNSGNITPMDTWMTNTVTFIPNQNFTWILLQISGMGCSISPYILIDNISAIVPSLVLPTIVLNNNVSCPGGTNGNATVHVLGQNPPFTYSWNSAPVQTDSLLDNVPAGIYTVTVTNTLGCTGTATVNISQPPAIVLTPTLIMANCPGANTGSAYMSYAGGTPPFTFLWSNGPATQPNGNLFAGVYGITATDANLCTASASITITEPPPINIPGVITNASCIGNNGSIATAVTGGTAGYTYSWNTVPVQNGATATGLGAGTYTVTVTDANLCTASASFTVTAAVNTLTLPATPVPVLCFGQSTGAVNTTPGGGTPGYTYSWNTVPVQNGQNATGLPAGTYTVTMTDAASCTITASATVTQPPSALSATIVETDVLCFGMSTGSSTVTPAGGTAGYTYSWNTVPVQTTAIANNIPAGNYTVTVTDANSCTFSINTTVSQPVQLSISAVITNATCAGNNGSVAATAANGTPGYTYSWNTVPVQNTATATGLNGGTYTVTATDANLCTISASYVVGGGVNTVSVSLIPVPVLCFGQSTGAVNSTPAGGTPGYTYNWNTVPVQNTQNATGLPAGTYTITVTDINLCTATATATVTQPATAVSAIATETDVLCFGNATGSATVVPAGGTPGYTYSWNTVPVQTTATASNLTAGIYDVTVTDANACTVSATTTINQPLAALTATLTQVDVLCFGMSTGSATVTAAGGTAGYTYSWNTIPVQTTATASNIPAGTYTVTVTDANSCTTSQSATILQPAAALSGVMTQVDVLCFGDATGSATYTVAGGTVGYTYNWNTVPVQNTATASNLTAGTYNITVTDANACTISATTTITQPAAPLSGIMTQVDVLCFGDATGSATYTVSGGTTVYTYSWNTVPVQTTATASNLTAGIYDVTVTDANACTVSATTTINQPLAALTATLTQVDVLCFGMSTGSATVTAAGGTAGYTYSWNTIPVQTTATASNIPAGTYTVTVTDANSCTTSQSATILQPAAALSGVMTQVDVLCFGDATGSATYTVAGGTVGYTYNWNTVPVQNTATASNLTAGTYNITVTDANACTISATTTITQPAAPLSGIMTQVDVLCFGDATGSATYTVSGGTTVYTYSWNTVPVQTTATASNLTAGIYDVTVTDANACTVSATTTINQPLAALTATLTQVDVLCFGMSTGSATVTAAGGTAGYTYSWNTIPVQTTATASNIPAGTYTVTVTDANSCTTSQSATILQPAAALSGVMTQVDVLCFGDATGSATYTVAGGTVGYTYNWNTVPVQNTATASNLTAGTYNITVTDANACTISATTTITQPAAPLTVTITLAVPPCFGAPPATATATAAGGTVGYNYVWNTVPVQNTAVASNLAPGTYDVTVTDANACTATSSVIVANPPSPITIVMSHIDVLCFGDATGSVTATASGSFGGYTYNWNTVPVQTTFIASNLTAGNYDVTVTDVQGCTAMGTDVVSQPASALTGVTNKTDVLCFGDATGSATVVAAGGTGGYTYNWNTIPVQTTATASNLTAGTYDITVTDANGCTVVNNATIAQPASPLTVTITLAVPPCFGAPPATATATAAGGTAGYNYVWNTVPVQNTATASNLTPGIYDVTVTDANACTVTSSVNVANPPTPITVVVSHIDVLCFGDATGSVTVAASGSFGSYSYNWNTAPVQTNATASNLTAGTYDVTVTDIRGCTATGTDVISQPASALAIATNKTDVLCFGDATGSATVVANGGTPGYTYVWSTAPVQTTVTASNIPAGTYNVTVTDANGCSQTTPATIVQPATPLAAVSSTININCFGANNGSISVTASGGTAAYFYNWSAIPNVNAPNENNLQAGSYSVTVTDANSCTFVINNMVITQPTAISITPVVVNVSCPGFSDGSIDAVPGGGVGPYSFNWSNAANTELAANLSGGSYTVTLTDNNGCTFSNTTPVLVLPGISLNSGVRNVLCFPLHNGEINLTASTLFPPLQYIWSTGLTAPTIASLDTGTYSVTITDSHGCVVDTAFQIGNDNIYSINTTPADVTINLGQSVDITVTPNGSTFGTILWQPSTGLSCSDCATPNASPIQSIIYNVYTTDTNGCIANDMVHINVIPVYTVFIPNVFTPNGDGFNDFFEIFGNKEAWKQFDVQVFDRWGEKVYESGDMNFKWDGTYKGKDMNPQVLVYQIHVVYLDNYTDKIYKGSVTLLK